MEITTTFSLQGEDPHSVKVVAGAASATPAKPVDTSKFSFGYTGRHDGGELLPVNSSSPYFGMEHAVGVSSPLMRCCLHARLTQNGLFVRLPLCVCASSCAAHVSVRVCPCLYLSVSVPVSACARVCVCLCPCLCWQESKAECSKYLTAVMAKASAATDATNAGAGGGAGAGVGSGVGAAGAGAGAGVAVPAKRRDAGGDDGDEDMGRGTVRAYVGAACMRSHVFSPSCSLLPGL